MSARTEEIAEYAGAVRAALADVPEDDRAELLEDLEDHLAEVAAESGEPLVVRLGIPEVYAAELRAAYGAVSGRRSPRSVVTGAFDTAENWLRAKAAHPAGTHVVWSYVRELRPVWWVTRAYLAAMLIWWWADGGRIAPSADAQDWAILLFFLAVSVVVGVRTRDKGVRGTLRAGVTVVNVAAAAGIAALVFQTVSQEPDETFAETPASHPIPAPNQGLRDVANIFPRSKDGKPLKDVLLYDQNGRPVQLDYEGHGYELERCGKEPPIANNYPLPLKSVEDDPMVDEGDQAPVSPCPKPSGEPGE